MSNATNSTTPAETLNLDNDTAGDWLVTSLLTQETGELLHGKISYGEGDIASKALRVLDLGSNQILDRKTPSPAFLMYVAICIRKCIDEGQSLDRAFGLSKGPGRPKLDPQVYDHIIDAYYGEMIMPSSDPIDRERCAFNAAFKAMHGMTPDEMKSRRFDEKSIDNRRSETRKFLASRGHKLST